MNWGLVVVTGCEGSEFAVNETVGHLEEVISVDLSRIYQVRIRVVRSPANCA